LVFLVSVFLNDPTPMENLEASLQEKVIKISQVIGERNLYWYQNLMAAADYIASEFKDYGYNPSFQTYLLEGKVVRNIIAEKRGKRYPNQIFVVGAHYDTALGTPGADDNGSGVSVLLALANLFSGLETDKSIRFVAFASEEPPYFGTELMGSRVYAKECKRKGESIFGMVSLECIGFYTRELKKRSLPSRIMGLFYPAAGYYLAIVGAPRYRGLTERITREFRNHSQVKVWGISIPRIIPGIDFSDHASFWKEGYPAVMVTDTAFYRNPHYHQPTDTYEKLNYPILAEVTKGLYYAIFSMIK